MRRLSHAGCLACGTTLALLSTACAVVATRPPAPAPPAAGPAPPGYSTALAGGSHDFDYLPGAWTTQQRRLKARAVGSSEWQEAPANRHCAAAYMDGRAVVEESRLPNGTPAGLFLYAFSPLKRQWSIYWVNPKTGQPDPGTVGGFAGTRGEFYGADQDNGRPVKVRIRWTVFDHDHARWEQAFSYDNRTWETNWVSDLTRADPALVCPKS
jgi:hypothetical protein